MSPTRHDRRGLGGLVHIVVLAAATLVVIVLGITVWSLLTDDGEPEREDLRQADLRNGRAFIQSNLWNAGDRQYAVWVGEGDRAFAGVRDRGSAEWEVTDLGDVPGNPLGVPVAKDDHNVFAIATDAAGRIHVAGNMHGDRLRYARSSQPHDLSTLRGADLPAAADSTTYPRFVGLPDGTLLFLRREGTSGNGAIVLDLLSPGAETWESVGPVIDGRPTGESPYLHNVAVDPEDGTVHVLIVWRRGQGVATNNDVSYARSADGGRTWTTSGGEPLPTPVTHDDAELVVDTDQQPGHLVNHGGFAVDADGRPVGLVAFSGGSEERFELVQDTGSGWRRRSFDRTGIPARAQLIVDGSADIWLAGVRGGQLAILPMTAEGVADPMLLGRVPRGWEPVIDNDGANDGRVELFVPDGNRPRVITVDVDELP